MHHIMCTNLCDVHNVKVRQALKIRSTSQAQALGNFIYEAMEATQVNVDLIKQFLIGLIV
jgi:hypothetical protein